MKNIVNRIRNRRKLHDMENTLVYVSFDLSELCHVLENYEYAYPEHRELCQAFRFRVYELQKEADVLAKKFGCTAEIDGL